MSIDQEHGVEMLIWLGQLLEPGLHLQRFVLVETTEGEMAGHRSPFHAGGRMLRSSFKGTTLIMRA